MEPTYWFAKAILKPFLGTWFRWYVEGLENIPARGPAIVAFNHIAYLDPLVAAYVIDKAKRRPRFLAKADLFEDKRIAWILKGAGQIEVRRGTRDAPMALDAALDALRRDQVIVIFPEGTITDDPDLSPMAAKTGATRLALASGVPVVPAALWGTSNVWGKGSAKNWRPGQQVCARIGAPMRLTGDPTSPQEWRDGGRRIMDEISALVASLRPVVPDRRRYRKDAA
ncbi:MAG: lysophospholipid acyltransferase family protein [Actinomycetota bacterium]